MSPLFIAAPAWVAGSGSNHAKSQGGDHSQQRGDRLSARPNSSKPGGAQPGSTRTTDGSEPSPRPAVTHGKYKSNPISLSAPARPAASCPAKPPAHPNRLPQPVLQIKPNSPSAPGSPPRSTERTHRRAQLAAATRITNQTQFAVRTGSPRRARPNEPTGAPQTGRCNLYYKSNPIRRPHPAHSRARPNEPTGAPQLAAATCITNQTQFAVRTRLTPALDRTNPSAHPNRLVQPELQIKPNSAPAHRRDHENLHGSRCLATRKNEPTVATG